MITPRKAKPADTRDDEVISADMGFGRFGLPAGFGSRFDAVMKQNGDKLQAPPV